MSTSKGIIEILRMFYYVWFEKFWFETFRVVIISDRSKMSIGHNQKSHKNNGRMEKTFKKNHILRKPNQKQLCTRVYKYIY